MSSGSIHTERSYATFLKYYDSIFIVAKKEIYRVYLWLYQGGSEYVGDYLATTPRGMRKMKSIEKEALRKKDNSSSFDIPFLYNLMQHVSGLAEDTSPIWHNPSTPEEMDSLEHVLYKLKELRNLICHCPHTFIHLTPELLDQKLDEVKDLCSHMVRKAGEKVHRTPEEVDTWIGRTEDSLTEIKRSPPPSGLDAKKFAVLAKQEMFSRRSPFSSRSSFVMPLIHSKGETGRHEMSLKLLPLWRCDDGSIPKVIVLQGDTGTGKTSTCRYLHDSWLSNDRETNDLLDFDLVLYIPCCEISTNDLEEFLSRRIFTNTMKSCNREELLVFLQSLKILWVIDSYEEATVEALQLLEKIVEQGNSSHQVLITTKPSYCLELLQRFNIQERLCQASLSGLSDEGVQSFLMKNLQQENYDLDICQTKVSEFLFTVASLGDGPQTDMRVPLKLELMLELWKRDKLEKRSSIGSLTHIYKTILEVQVERLTTKMQKETKHSKQEITKRILEWVKVLCEIAFQMTMKAKFVRIDAKKQENLRKEAKSLNYPEDCLSIFLQPEENGNPDTTTSYRFFHGSHQIYLSAQHFLSLLFNIKNPTKTIKRHFKKPINHYLYLLLVQVLSGIPKDSNLERTSVGPLVEFISKCSEFDGFQLVKEADYSPKVVEEVSKHVNRNWDVTHLNIRAAHKLIEYFTPMEINLRFFDSNDKEELYTFFESVSQKQISLKLQLPATNTNINANNISFSRCLTPVYSSNAKCHLTEFNGMLNHEEIRFTEHMTMVTILGLTVISNDILEKILDNLMYMRHLEILCLIFAMPVIIATQSVELPDRCSDFSVELRQIDELQMRETGRSLCKLSKSYDRILLLDMSATAASELVEELERENVRVYKYIRCIGCSNGAFHINYGSLPLSQPMSLFKEKWLETYVGSYVDDLGIKRQTLVTHGNISSKDVIFGGVSLDCELQKQTF